MEYRNIKTGAVVSVQSELRGDWELVEKPTPISVDKAEKAESVATEKPKRTRKAK